MNTIKQIISDLSRVYRNFFHWNISKIIILLSSILLGVLLAIPFLIIMVIIGYLDPIEWKEIIYTMTNQDIPVGPDITANLLSNIGFTIIHIIIFIIGAFAFLLGYSYKNYLLARANFCYLSGSRLSFTENKYFSIAHVIKFGGILIMGSLILLLPILFLIISFFVLISILGGGQNALATAISGPANIFSVSLLVIFVLCVIVFIYLSYRLTFSYIILAREDEDHNLKSSLSYIKASFDTTKGFKKLGIFIMIFLGFSLILAPFNYISIHFDETSNDIDNYLYILQNGENSFITKNLYQYGSISSSAEELDWYIAGLQLQYGSQTILDLYNQSNNYKIYSFLYGVFMFLVIYGLIDMLIVSIYTRVMILESIKPRG